MEEITKYVFNINDVWTDDVDYIQDTIIDLELTEVEIGQRHSIYHKDILELSDLIEAMQDRAYDFGDEYSEAYLTDLSSTKAEELEEIILEWFNYNVAQPNFYKVKNTENISVEEFYARFVKGDN